MAKRTRDRGGQKKRVAKGRPSKSPSSKAANVTSADPDWMLFVAEYKDKYPALIESAVYALPERLIRAIQRQVPGLFLAEDVTFERNLARFGGAGFFLGRPFGHPLLAKRERDPRETEAQKEIDDSSQQALRRIEEMLDEGMREMGRSAEQIQQFHREKKRVEARLRQQQMSYLGWLLTNPRFQSERDAFFDHWEPVMGNLGSLQLPLSFVGEVPKIRKKARKLYDDMLVFFRRWCIGAFVTRDLPILLQPQITSPALHHLPSMAEAGILLFIPWYLLRKQAFKLHELLELQLLSRDQSHLEPWLDGERKWGHTRFARMFELYVYLELGLKQRYPDRIRGDIERLDLAFTQFFSGRLDDAVHGVGMDKEKLRRTRLEMNRRLRVQRLPGPNPQNS
jgi:hypothetical protein